MNPKTDILRIKYAELNFRKSFGSYLHIPAA